MGFDLCVANIWFAGRIDGKVFVDSIKRLKKLYFFTALCYCFPEHAYPAVAVCCCSCIGKWSCCFEHCCTDLEYMSTFYGSCCRQVEEGHKHFGTSPNSRRNQVLFCNPVNGEFMGLWVAINSITALAILQDATHNLHF